MPYCKHQNSYMYHDQWFKTTLLYTHIHQALYVAAPRKIQQNHPQKLS